MRACVRAGFVLLASTVHGGKPLSHSIGGVDFCVPVQVCVGSLCVVLSVVLSACVCVYQLCPWCVGVCLHVCQSLCSLCVAAGMEGREVCVTVCWFRIVCLWVKGNFQICWYQLVYVLSHIHRQTDVCCECRARCCSLYCVVLWCGDLTEG